ncbi:MAG: GIY-YIG nuclease family protein [Candidatus Methanomethylicaceae archaeon]
MKGGYALLIELDNDLVLNVKRKEFLLRRGFYLYSGSALSGLECRVKRHMRNFKKKNPITNLKETDLIKHHWHIDYLIPSAASMAIVYWECQFRTECLLVNFLKEEGAEPIRGFGNTDCKSKCGGHLLKCDTGNISETINLIRPFLKKMKLQEYVMFQSSTSIGNINT